jgi:hypothetical protein
VNLCRLEAAELSLEARLVDVAIKPTIDHTAFKSSCSGWLDRTVLLSLFLIGTRKGRTEGGLVLHYSPSVLFKQLPYIYPLSQLTPHHARLTNRGGLCIDEAILRRFEPRAVVLASLLGVPKALASWQCDRTTSQIRSGFCSNRPQ